MTMGNRARLIAVAAVCGALWSPPASAEQRQVIRSPSGLTMGTIVNRSNGQEARSPGGALLGTYDPRANVTKTPSGQVVARGNTLSNFFQKR